MRDNKVASIRTKTMLTVLPLIIVISILLSGVSYYYSFKLIEREMDKQMQLQLQATQQSFRTELTAHKAIGETLARIAEKSNGAFSKKQYAAFLQNIITSDPHTLGAGIWYEPFRYKADVRYFGPYVYKDKGHFVYTEYYEKPEYDFPNQGWYKIATHTTKSVVWTDPYFDDFTKITMITASFPFYDENKKLKGMATADLDLSDLQKTVTDIKVGNKGWAFLLDRTGTYMADRDNRKVMKVKITEDADAKVAAVGKEILANKNGQIIYHEGSDTYRVYYSELPDTGWILALTTPESELYTALNALLWKQVIIAVIAILLVVMIIMMYTRFISKNIAERKRAEEQLSQKNSELETAYTELKNIQFQVINQEKMASIGQLAAGVAHEINNPTAFIISNLVSLERYIAKITQFLSTQEEAIAELSILKESEPGGDKPAAIINKVSDIKKSLKIDYILNDAVELVQETQDGAGRIKDIVQNLKGFARVEIESCLANINEGLESTITIIWNELKYKATLEKELGDIPWTKCNLGQLNQVFMNLLVNAAHAIEGCGEIRVKTWADEENIFIAITDTGSGIRPEIMDKIFEPFFTTKEIGKGTGLGLSITYEIVKKHGGEIKVDSEVGRGTTFTISIPIVEE